MAFDQNDNSALKDNLFVGVIASLAIIIFIAYFKPDLFYGPWLLYSKVNVYLIEMFSNDPNVLSKAAQFWQWEKVVHAKDVTIAEFSAVNEFIGPLTQWYYFVGILLVGGVVYRKKRKESFKLFTYEELIRLESKVWPPLKFFVKHNPLKEPENFPDRVSPWDWAKEHGVIKKNAQGEVFVKQDVKQEILINQLGEPFFSSRELLNQSLETRVVIAFCMNRINAKDASYYLDPVSKIIVFLCMIKRLKKPVEKKLKKITIRLQKFLGVIKGEKDLLEFISDYYSAPDSEIKSRRREFSRAIDEKIKENLDSKKIRRLMSRHAYPSTLILGLIMLGRESGKLPSTWFPFLRVYEPNLFWLLNDVGRQRPSITTAGIFSHFGAEKEAKKRLVTPWVSGVDLETELYKVGVLDSLPNDSNG